MPPRDGPHRPTSSDLPVPVRVDPSRRIDRAAVHPGTNPCRPSPAAGHSDFEPPPRAPLPPRPDRPVGLPPRPPDPFDPRPAPPERDGPSAMMRGTVRRHRSSVALQNEENPARGGVLQCEIRRRPTLPGDLSPSTIGAGGLNFRVRNGNGCDPTAVATETFDSRPPISQRRPLYFSRTGTVPARQSNGSPSPKVPLSCP